MFVVLVNYTLLLQCRANFVFLSLIWLLCKQHPELFTISCGAFKRAPVLRGTLFPLLTVWFSQVWTAARRQGKASDVFSASQVDQQPGSAVRSVVASSQKRLGPSQTIPLGFSDLHSVMWVGYPHARSLVWADQCNKAIAAGEVGSEQVDPALGSTHYCCTLLPVTKSPHASVYLCIKLE